MDKVKEFEAILKDLYKSRTELSLDTDFFTRGSVYAYLIKRNVNKSDFKQRIKFNLNDSDYLSDKNYFRRWEEYFEDIDNVEVLSTVHPYFCIFSNKDGLFDGLKAVKLYVPLDYHHLYEGVNKIFKFLADNDIKHESKVSSEIRFDDVVIRVSNLEDARRIQDFIDQDKYIQDGLFKGNVFAFDRNGINYAYDNHLSYNYYIATMIHDYIEYMASDIKMNINDVNISSFYSYVDMVSNDFDKMNSFLDSSDKDVNLEDAYFIVQLLKKSLFSNDFKDYEVIYSQACSVDLRLKLRKLINNSKGEDKKELFDELILTTLKKYPLGYNEHYPELSGLHNIICFLDGNIQAVTRDNHLRNRVFGYLTRDSVYDIVESSGFIGDSIMDKLSVYIEKVMFDDMIRFMKKDSPRSFISDLNCFMQTNDVFTLRGEARILAMTLQADDIKQFLSDLGLNGIEDYIIKYYHEENKKFRRRDIK